MKRYILLILFSFILLGSIFSPLTYAQITPAPVLQQEQGLPQEGAWIVDPTVTTIGKNAARSGMLLDWTLKDYKWASDNSYTNNPLVPLWLVIQRIVYALFLFVILVTAFILIITRGRSLSAKRFLPRFFLVVLLVTFSFSLVQFLYQIIDIFQGFFLKNASGTIISSRDLLYVGFDYKSFLGLRVFGQTYDESAFISLLLVKLTAFTYYAMVILLIFRKIILWFLIIVSPVFPLLLLFYPLRNTAKIWVGEFFRWLLYAPLFAIFLSGLVRLWHSGLPLIFNFTGVGNDASTVYPTAVNILLGGPGQSIGLHNSVNLPDTFALYLVALLMLWTVIILPFILLQVFLDYVMSFNYQNNPFIKQVYTMLNNRSNIPFNPLPPTQPPSATTGLARSLPFTKRFEMPKTTGLAKQIPTTATRTVERPTLTTRNNQTEISRLTTLSIPTMRDIARFETTRLSKDVMSQREIERTRQTLVNIANPTSINTSTERDRFRMIRDRLITEGQKGNSVASTILNAATTYNSYNSESSSSTVSQQTQQLIQHLSSPSTIISKRDQQKIVEIKQELINAANEGNQFASSVLNSVNTYTTNQVTQIEQLLQGLSNPEKVTSPKEKEVYTSLREKIMNASKSGNPLASLIAQSIEGSTSQEQVKKIQNQLIEAKAQGNPLATELLKTVSSSDKTTEQDMEKLHATLQEASQKGDPLATLLLKTLTSEQRPQTAPVSATAKLKAGTLPQVNRIQQVSLDDYEAVKKMWKDNYKNVEVPQGVNSQQNRKEWITEDIASIQETVSLLSSSNPQEVEKGMQQVSDILPFLLIGGFSQTEIIAYLKAKMEAGKNVLEEVGSQSEEEDTLLETKRTTKTATNHLAASAEINQDAVSSQSTTTNVLPSTTNNYTTITNNESKENVFVTKSEDITKIDTKLLERTQLTVPTLKEIAQFDTKTTEKSTSEMNKVMTVLYHIAHPESIVNTQEKERYTQLKEELVKESQNTNPLAVMILNATESMEHLPEELTPDEIVAFSRTIQNILTPEVITENTKSESYKELNTLLMQQVKQNDPLASLVMKESTELQTHNYEHAKEFLEKLSNPSSLTTASEQMHYNKLVERIAQSSEDGNPTAKLILKTVREPITKEGITNLIAVLSNNSGKGDTLATYIHDSITATPGENTSAMASLYKQMISAKNQNNPLAVSLLKLFTKELHPAQKGIKSVMLPAKNRLQQVSVDDYETVKKLWEDNYHNAPVPANMTRESWITQEGNEIADTINLLSSSDPAMVQKGMEKVGDILPFLLLGGFSKDEIIGYLKAKLGAGRDVLKIIQTQESQKVPATRTAVAKPSPKVQTAHMQAEPPVPLGLNDVTAQVKDADIFLLTLRCILDPSLVEDPTSQQNYRTARDMFMQARQKGDAWALRLMKLLDIVALRETDALVNLLKSLSTSQQIVDDLKRRTYETLLSRLENARGVNQLAETVLTLVRADITTVSANKVRVLLIEGQAKHEPLATGIMATMVTLPDNLRNELIATADLIMKAKNTDAFSMLFVRLFNEQKKQLREAFEV